MKNNMPKSHFAIGTGPKGNVREAVRSIAVILLSLWGAVFVSEALYGHIAVPQNLVMIYVLAVLIISVFTSHIYSILGTLAAVVAYDYLINMPRLGFSFTIGFPMTMIIMLIVSLTIRALVTKIKTIAAQALAANHKTEIVYHLVRDFLTVDDRESLVRIAGSHVMEHTGRAVCFYLGDPAGQETKAVFMEADAPAGAFDFSEAQCGVAAALYKNDGEAYVFDSGAGLSYWKLSSGGEPLGVMCVALAERPLEEAERLLLEMIGAQMSIVLGKINISEQRKDAEIMAKTERERSSLLSGISHDLRNPLTSILGAVSMLIDSGKDILQESSAIELLQGIYSDTDWLLRMVENILTTTRLQAANMKVAKKMEAPEELIDHAVGQIRKRYPGHHIRIAAPQELVMVPMDPILITQVLINFLENAVKHSSFQDEIKVTLSVNDDAVLFSVADRGPGIVFLESRNLFEIDPRQGGEKEDSARGMGMGLSICKTIILAHGGEIGAENIAQGGALFWFTLPLQA